MMRRSTDKIEANEATDEPAPFKDLRGKANTDARPKFTA
jgi:hypothetical protein